MAARCISKEAAVMMLVAVAVNIAFLYGLITRPVISYHLATPLNYNETIDFSSEDLEVDFIATNMGASPAQVHLVISFYNLTLESPEGLSVSKDGYYELAHSLEIAANEQGRFSATFANSEEANYLVIVYSIEVDKEAGLATRYYNSFTIFQMERPTALLLKGVGENRFIRVTGRS